jgi:hypothetical protein
LGVAASQIVIPALSRDPLGRRKNHGDIACSVQRLGAMEEWAPAQGRGDDRVFCASPERIAA